MDCRIVNVFVCFLWESLESLNSYFHSFGSGMQFLICIIEFLIPLIAKDYKVERAGQQNHWEARAENEYCILCSAKLHSAILFRLALCPLQHCEWFDFSCFLLRRRILGQPLWSGIGTSCQAHYHTNIQPSLPPCHIFCAASWQSWCLLLAAWPT